MQSLTIFLLIISALQRINADNSCNEENLQNCLGKFQGYFEDYYHFVKKTVSEFDEFCSKLQEDSTCMDHASEECKEAYPLISAIAVMLYNHVNQLCNLNKRETYRKVLPCVHKHSKEFDECSGKNHEKKYDDEQMQSVCMDMNSMLCVAEKSRKHCGGEGESLAKILEIGVKDKYHEVCSGCSGLFNHYWAFGTVLVAFLLRLKMKL